MHVKLFFFLWGHLNSAWKPCLIIHCRGRQRVCQIHSKKAGTFFTAKQHKAVYWTNYTASARVAIPSPGVSAFTFLSWITSIAVCNDKYTLDKKKKSLEFIKWEKSDYKRWLISNWDQLGKSASQKNQTLINRNLTKPTWCSQEKNSAHRRKMSLSGKDRMIYSEITFLLYKRITSL